MSPKILNILLIISSVVLYYYVVDPLYSGADSTFFSGDKNIPKLIEKRNTYDKTIEAFPLILSQAATNQKQFEALQQDDIKTIMTMVPVSVDDIKLMSEITNIAAESGIPLDNMGIKDKIGEYTVSFTVLTTYTNFKKIIALFEKSMRLFTLQSVSFTPGKTEEDLVKYNVEFSTYYMK